MLYNSFYLTYKELKLILLHIFHFQILVFILPIRN
uniref:Uncharacterized protein n=1 Tax=Geobacillus sp. (strain Y4.1MC1) TaxID=581103 RepID=A0A7U4DL64_GEOS0